jgi:hypothetical protein
MLEHEVWRKPIRGVADLRYEFSFVGFLKPRPKLTFGWVQGCHSYLDSATPYLVLLQ